MPASRPADVLYRERIDRLMDHIVLQPAADLSLDGLARIAHFSPFHLHRIFRALTGETLKAFVLRARLERALALMAAAPRKPLGLVAAEVGFGSAASFSRAFRRTFGVAPSSPELPSVLAARREADGHDALRRHLWVRHRGAMPAGATPPQIVERAALPLSYVRVTGGYVAPDRLVAGYRRLQDWIDAERIDRSRSLLIGLAVDDPDLVPLGRCRYDFACSTPVRPRRGSGLGRCEIPAASWAVVPVRGDLDQVAATWEWLFRHWLPSSGFQPGPLPAMEVFHQRPEDIGWDRFDLDCCVPVEPLST